MIQATINVWENLPMKTKLLAGFSFALGSLQVTLFVLNLLAAVSANASGLTAVNTKIDAFIKEDKEYKAALESDRRKTREALLEDLALLKGAMGIPVKKHKFDQ